ncbi:MAG: cobalt-precorrin-6A reductase, partial [Hyphomicrobiales bacterium]|nr:cobalt-precorrin-6A reductase [Hyphomicrobiales bacterium]
YLRDNGIGALIDATHPFAAQMSVHAVAAAEAAGLPLIALERPPWTPEPGDDWREVDTLEEAADALGETPRKIFLAIGRLHLGAFAEKPQHSYVVRLVDPPQEKLPLPDVNVLVGRGPFRTADDLAMMRDHGIEAVVAKNAGGPASYAKIEAARLLGIPVILQRRPFAPARETAATVEAVLAWLASF